MLTLVTAGTAEGKFEGTKGLGRGPEALEWDELSVKERAMLIRQSSIKQHAWTTDKSSIYFQAENSEQGDNPRSRPDTHQMNDITRDELNAKLETIEVKMDARVEAVSAKIEGFLAAQTERDKRLDAVLAQIGKDNGETKSSISSMKTTLVVTALSTVVAIVLGVAGFNTALTSNMLSAFQAGKSDQSPTAVVQPAQIAPPAQQQK